jgi:hypothetical protein
MRWLSNAHNPEDPYASMYVVRLFPQSQEEAWRSHLDWLRDKVIGKPKETEKYTVEELEEMEMVGVYSRE